MSMIYKRTEGFKKQKQPIPECLTPTHREEPHADADAERRRVRKRGSLLSDIDRPATDIGVEVRRRAGDDSAFFNPTENWLLSEVAAADRCTTTAATAPFTGPQELNYYSTTRKTNLTPTFKSSCNTRNFDKCANFGPQFSGGTLFEGMSVPILFNNNNNNPTNDNNNNNNPNLNFENRNLLQVASQPSTKSGPYSDIYDSEESDLAFSGILSPSPSTIAQPEQIMPDTRIQQFNPNTTTQNNPQICNNIYPGAMDGNCFAYDNDDECTQKIKKMKLSRSTSNFSHFSVTFPQTIIPDQRRIPQPTSKATPRRVHAVERDRQREVNPIVISDDKPNAITNKTTEQTKTALLKYSKKDTNMPQMVPFLREGKSVYNFFNDADLRRMVGDLRTQMSIRGLCVFDNFLGVEKAKLVLKDVSNLYKKGCFVNGQLESSSAGPFLDNTRVIRGDIIKWLDGDERDCGNIKHLMERIDAAVMMCGEQMFSGYTIKQRTRAMVACYPGNGTHYLRHIDNPCGNGRVLTCIYYLNLNWDVRTDGGLLRIYPKGIDEVANIEPIFDRVLFFWSDARNPHEVKPAYRKRFAITLWYYDERERLDWQMRRCAETQSTSPSP